MKPVSILLKDKTRFYQQINTGIRAGLTVEQVLRGRVLPPVFAKKSALLLKGIEQGKPLSTLLRSNGMVSDWEADLIQIGESGGKLETALSELEYFFSEKNRQLGRLKTKLVYPFLVLLVAITVLPLPELAANTVSPAEYVIKSAFLLLLIYLGYRLCIVAPFTKSAMGAFNPWLLFAIQRVGDNHFLRKLYEISYLNLLTMCLQSGMDAAESLRLLKKASRDRNVQHRHTVALNEIENRGESLTNALRSNGILRHWEVTAFLNSSERSGTLHSDLKEYAGRQKAAVGAILNYWINRLSAILYCLVVFYVVSRILAKGMPVIMGQL